MRIFISSLITGMEDVRASAATAIEALGHTVVRAEDFDAKPTSSRAACLAAVRASDATVLILGEQYGAVQASGLSATHEEFNEAREHSPTFVFVREGISPDQRQEAFIKEARDWQSGRYTAGFSSPDQLQQRVTTALHRWEVERASGSVDAEEMIVRADALLKESAAVVAQPPFVWRSARGRGARYSARRTWKPPPFVRSCTRWLCSAAPGCSCRKRA